MGEEQERKEERERGGRERDEESEGSYREIERTEKKREEGEW